jgi:hypothetical protein
VGPGAFVAIASETARAVDVTTGDEDISTVTGAGAAQAVATRMRAKRIRFMRDLAS